MGCMGLSVSVTLVASLDSMKAFVKVFFQFFFCPRIFIWIFNVGSVRENKHKEQFVYPGKISMTLYFKMCQSEKKKRNPTRKMVEKQVNRCKADTFL